MTSEDQQEPAAEPQQKQNSALAGMAKKRTAARNTIDNLWTSLAPTPVQLVSSVLVAQALGPANRGVFAFLLLFNAFGVPLAMMGFAASVAYYVSSRRYPVADIAFTSIIVGLLHGLLASGIILTLWHFQLLGEVASTTPKTLVFVMALLLPLHSSFLVITRIFLGDSRFALQNRLIMAREFLLSTLMIVVVWLFGWGLEGAVAVATIMASLCFLAGASCVWILYRPKLRLHFPFMKDGYLYGLRAWFGNQAQLTNSRLDHVILGYFCKADALGWYSVATKLTESMRLLPDALAFVVFNKIAAHKGKKQSAELLETVHRPLFWSMFLLSIVAGVASFWVIPLPFLYGKEFAPAALALALLLPGSLAVTSSRITSKYFAGKGRPELNGLTAVIGAVASVILYPAMILSFRQFDWFGSVSAGFIGATIACSLVYWVIALSKIILYRRMIAPRKSQLFRLQRSDFEWVLEQARRGIGHAPKQKASASDIIEPVSETRT